jgi:GNAT superfamily N-acetyltransferase
MRLTFRRFVATDRAQVLDRILAEGLINDYLSRSLRYRIAALLGLCTHLFYVLVNTESGEILGTVALRRSADRYLLGFDWWIVGLRVIRGYRGEGLGRKLVELALAELRSLGANRVFVHLVPQDGVVSKRLFAGSAFEFINATFTFTKQFLASPPLITEAMPIVILRGQQESAIPFQTFDREISGHARTILLTAYRKVLSCLGLLRMEFFPCPCQKRTLPALITRYFFLRIKVELFVSNFHDSKFLASAASAYFAVFRLPRFRKVTVDIHCSDPSCPNLNLALSGVKAYDRQNLMVYYFKQ